MSQLQLLLPVLLLLLLDIFLVVKVESIFPVNSTAINDFEFTDYDISDSSSAEAHEEAMYKGGGDSDEIDNKIIGGFPTIIRKTPYLVYVRNNGFFICGGALVTPRFVVSAAHCYYGSENDASQFDVTGGSSYRSSGGKRSKVNFIALPRRYNENTLHMDVAVLRLVSDLRGKHIGTIALCRNSIPVGASIKVAGWGTMDRTGPGSGSDRVHAVILNRVKNKRCIRSYRGVKLTNTMFCAMFRGRDSCSGDSGGPAVYKKKLCGIVSWGDECARTKFPGVYTNVRAVSAFIRKTIKRLS